MDSSKNMDNSNENAKTAIKKTDVTVKEIFFDKIRILYDTYDKVKLAIIWAEKFDPGQQIYLAPINQLRSSLDHIFKAVAHNEDIDYELKEAKEHLERAGYDAYEVLASNVSIQIINKINKYSQSAISAVIPTYYTTIRPEISEIQREISKIRKEKKDNGQGCDVPFSAYHDKAKQLMDFDDQISKVIPSLEEYHKKEIEEDKIKQKGLTKQKNIERIFKFAITLVVGLILIYITNNLKKTQSTKLLPQIEKSNSVKQNLPNTNNKGEVNKN